VALAAVFFAATPGFAEEPPADKFELKDGSTLFLHPDGTGRMIGRASASPRLELQAVAGITAWGVMRDADDVPQVVRAVWP